MYPAAEKRMAVSIVAGTNGLLQLGLSISDLALLIDQGKKFGNFVRAGQNDDDLFDILNEDREAVLQRQGLVETHEMEKAWPKLEFVHQGMKVKGRIHEDIRTQSSSPDKSLRKKQKKDKPNKVDGFTWVMVAIVSALDDCLPSNEIRELLIRVFVTVLEHDDDQTEEALRIHIKTNIESWRSFGCARRIAYFIKTEMRRSLAHNISGPHQARAIPQLNGAEKQDMEYLLVWLLRKDTTTFSAMSAITFSIAEAWRAAKLHVCTDGNPRYEGQACVTYDPQGQLFKGLSSSTVPFSRGLGSRALQISWPRDKPETMIDTLGVGRTMENTMERFWQYGKKAADEIQLFGKADGPYEATKEVYYSIDVPPSALTSKRFRPHIGMIANQGFPLDSHKIYEALELMLEQEPSNSAEWLQSHVARDYLLRAENAHASHEPGYMSVLSKYQALMFGFYYRLLEQILSFDLVEPTAFFHGVWGAQSTTFLAMCTQLSSCLRSSEKASRAHILYMLAAMYNGRRKIFNVNSSNPQLVGVIGPISILALPLIRTTDIPEEIWKIAVVDLPIVDLNADNSDGELMASEGGGIRFVSASEDSHNAMAVQSFDPIETWTVHPHMSMTLGGEKSSGVVMAARHGKRLVGWFNPLAADISFLSSAYMRTSYSEEEVVAFEVKDERWVSGTIPQPEAERQGYQFGIIRSRNSPMLRYAAAGFYAEQGEEVAIARSENEISGAFGRIQAQGQGMVIA
jgi:hypothetical protein